MTMLPVVFSISKSMFLSPPGVGAGGKACTLSDGGSGSAQGLGQQIDRRW